MINVIVSTSKTQKQRANDFCFVPENEIVMFWKIPDKDIDNPADSYSWARSVFGVKCHTATTTVKVVESAMTREEYRDKYFEGWKRTGRPISRRTKEGFANMYLAAQKFGPGTVLEYRNGEFAER